MNFNFDQQTENLKCELNLVTIHRVERSVDSEKVEKR